MFADLARIKLPVSLIAAGEGGVVTEEDIGEFRRVCPGAQVVRVPGVGHQMQAEDFDAFSRALGDVLNRFVT
jgi:N-formylmaleamate deformylase